MEAEFFNALLIELGSPDFDVCLLAFEISSVGEDGPSGGLQGSARVSGLLAPVSVCFDSRDASEEIADFWPSTWGTNVRDIHVSSSCQVNV